MRIVNKLIIVIRITILILAALVLMPAGAQEARTQPNLEKILVYPGDKIELYYDSGAKKTFLGGYDYETVTSAIGEADIIFEINEHKYYIYSELKITFIIDWANKIQQIEIGNPLAQTNKGVKMDNSFNKAINIYGKPDEDYNPYNVPSQPALNNNRLMVYKGLGILFYGTVNPDKITYMVIFSPKI